MIITSKMTQHHKACQLIALIIYMIWSHHLVICQFSGRNENIPPKFLSESGSSEIVVRVKEGSSALGKEIYHLVGEDQDGDPLKFGVLGSIGEELLKIENSPPNEASVFLKKELDRETQDSYTLVLTLTDGKLGKGHYITKTLLIIVEDINDNTPIFRPYHASISLSESSRPGPVETIEAYDQDEGRFGQVLYKLIEIDSDSSEKSGTTFSVETVEGKGVISLISELDYERKSIYQLRILAIDRAIEGQRKTGTASIVIQVEDAEDQGPVFTYVPSVTRISEDLEMGAQVLRVKAVDGDRGVNNAVTYRLIKGGRGLFGINQSTGIVTVTGKLDRESAISESTGDSAPGAFILKIEATEVTSVIPNPSVTTEVTIILTDVNDELPQFRSKQYSAEINENAQTDMPVTFVGNNDLPQVFDLDQGTNGTFTLSIQPDEAIYSDVFYVTPKQVVNEASFIIRVKDGSLLDYEKLKSIQMKLVAKEKLTNEARSSTAQVTIRIKDVNDNFPKFENDIYRGSVDENAPKGTTIAVVKAHDVDSGIYGTLGIRYTGITGEISKYLYLDPFTGIITVSSSSHNFDREQVSQYFLTVEARDDNGNGNRNTVQLVVNVTDVNDNRPKFLHDHYEAKLYEHSNDFESIVRVTATDQDAIATPNSEIRYLIVNSSIWSNYLKIDSESGRVRVRQSIDFEQIPGPHGESRNISLIIRAQDLGQPPLNSECQLTIHVFDRNDHSPVFTKSLYTKSISEDTVDGSSVIQVSASDGDHSPANSRVYYRIASGALDKFSIDANTGVISVATGANLDPDRSNPKKTFYLMEIIALDTSFGGQQRQSSTFVNVTITDVNNKPPVFVDPGTVTIPENSPNQFFVTKIIATDADEKPVLRYSIDYSTSEARNELGAVVQQNIYKNSFSINQVDGTIRVAKALDRESWDQIKLSLIVEDIAAATKGQIARSFITIKISDVNDNRPQFRYQVYRGVITENAVQGTPIVHVDADDLDSNKTVIYSLEGHNDIVNLVKIDPFTGDVSVAQRIDRERHSWINLTLRASDSGNPPLFGLSNLNIQVLDENDNNPIFGPDSRTEFTVTEDAPIGSLVGAVHANDEDFGVFGKVTYLLDASSSDGKFKIDRETGDIVVASKLDREQVSHYQLMVQAWDNYEFGFTTGESRKAFKTISVRILDVNDEAPIIIHHETQSGGCASITEFHQLGETITTVQVLDKDDPSTPNGRVSLQIVGGNMDSLFDIVSTHSNSAKIVSRFSLRGKVGNYTLTLKALDDGYPSKSSTGTVTICIADVNDHSPYFVKPPLNMTIRVPENATIGSSVVEVVALDEDSGKNAIVRYKFRHLPNGHWKWFFINEVTGMITVAKQLDREKQRIHEIRVEAYDLGEPTPLSTDLDLTILVTDVDDFSPEFTQDQFQLVFTENKLPGQEKFKLLPTIDRDDYDLMERDPSAAFKAIPCYYIVGGDGKDKFNLDTFTHELTTTEPLDREKKDSYVLIVQAKNDCFKIPPDVVQFDPKDNSLLQVLIGIKDVNDNPPKMLKKVFTGGFTTEVDFGTIFMEVKAIDNDVGANSIVRYYIKGQIRKLLSEGLDSIVKEPFSLNPVTGEISVNFDPQKDMKGYFEFDVIANDTDGKSDSAKVYIYLLREDQRVRFILRLTPQELREKLEQFRDVLANITGATVNIDFYKFHENRDGSVDKRKTDLYLHFVNREDNTIMNVANVLSLIDKNIDYLNELYKEFNVLVSEPAQGEVFYLDFEDQIKAGLVGTTAFLTLLLILVTCLCLNQKTRYERQLKAATASVFSSEPQLARSNVPNTNQHATEGSNPMWMHHAYDNHWYKDDEQISNHSTGGNSLDENAVVQSTNDSLDGSNNSGQRSNSSTSNERQALCRGIAVGRVTPQNITLPQTNTFNQHTKKPAPKPPAKPQTHQVVTCNAKNTINNVYIESYPNHNHHNHHTTLNPLNQMSLLNLETTEL